MIQLKVITTKPIYISFLFLISLAAQISLAYGSDFDIAESLPPPNLSQLNDKYGIDLRSQTFGGHSGMAVEIGGQGSGLSRFSATQRFVNDNHTGTITQINTAYRVVDGALQPWPTYLYGLPTSGVYVKVDTSTGSTVFSQNGNNYSNALGESSTLTCTSSSCTFNDKNGVVFEFTKNKTNYFASPKPGSNWIKNIALQTERTNPDGEVITNHYMASTQTGRTGDRLKYVISSNGWGLYYQYGVSESTLESRNSAIYQTAEATDKVIAFNTSVTNCHLTNSCANLSSANWPQATIWFLEEHRIPNNSSDVYKRFESEVTNAEGFTDSYSYSGMWGVDGEVHDIETFGGQVYHYEAMGCPTPQFNCPTNPGRIVEVRFANQQLTDYSLLPGESQTPMGIYELNTFSEIIEKYTDNLSRETIYTYIDDRGRYIDTITYPSGLVVDYDYDSRFNITSIKRTKGSVQVESSATYSPSCSNLKICNKPESVTLENGVTTTYTYHPQSGMIETISYPETTDHNGNKLTALVRFHYKQYYPKVKNQSGQLVNSTPVWKLEWVKQCMSSSNSTCLNGADEQVTEYEYNNHNLLVSKKTLKTGDAATSIATTYGYDSLGHLSWTDGPLPGAYDRSYSFYNKLNQLEAEIGEDIDASGPLKRKATRYVYNGNGDIISAETGLVSQTTLSAVNSMSVAITINTAYDANTGFKLSSQTYLDGNAVTSRKFSYDARYNLECERVAKTVSSSTACNFYAGSRVTHHGYDATDALTSITEGYGSSNEITVKANHYYAASGLLEYVEDGEGNRTYYEYDGIERLKKTIYPNPSNGSQKNHNDYEELFYQNGVLHQQRMRNGSLTTHTYDERGRLKEKTGGVKEKFSYDNFNNVVWHQNTTSGVSSTTESFTYHPLGWLKTEQTPQGTVTYGYNDYGQLERLTYPDNFYVTYDYLVGTNPVSMLQRILENGSNTIATLSYDGYGNRASLLRGNSVETQYDVDPLGRLSSQVTNLANNYHSHTESFEYTPFGQIEHKDFVYGSIYKHTKFAETQTIVNNALNQLDTVNGQTITYDSNGNLKAYGNTQYTYNNLNLLLSAVKGGNTTTLRYDAGLRLYSVNGSNYTRFQYAGSDLILERNSSGVIIRRYVHGPGIDDPILWYEGSGTTNKHYFHENYQGSVIGITDTNGDLVNTNTYDEYGEPGSNNTGRFQYTGQSWLDGLDVYYYKARIYHPKLGRFLQTDPVGYEDQMNLYAYVGNDPINNTDPTGMCTSDPKAAASDICQKTANMSLSQNGENHIKNQENPSGRLDVHDDGAGNPTSGYGHKDSSMTIGSTITQQQADTDFANDVATAESVVKNLVGSTQLSQNEYDAMTDLAFNVGAGTLNNSPNLKAAIAASDYEGMSNNLKYTKATNVATGQKVTMPGLANRSAARRVLFRGNIKYKNP